MSPNTKPCHHRLKHLNGLETKSLVGVAIDLGIPTEDECNKDSQRLFDTEENAKGCLHVKKHLNSIPATYNVWV